MKELNQSGHSFIATSPRQTPTAPPSPSSRAAPLVQGFSVAIASVTDDGLQLKHCSAAARDTLEVVLAAVRENGMALAWASPALQDDMDVVIAAVGCDETGDAIDFASGRLQTNEDVMETAIESLLRGDPTLET